VRTRPLLASSWLLHDPGGHGSTYALSETILPSNKCQGYLASEAPFILDPLRGLSLLLFGLEPQELVLLSSFLIVAI